MAESDVSNVPSPLLTSPADADDLREVFRSAWTDPPPQNAEEDPLLGTTLSRTYRITGVLGEGGMGRVYEAWHTRIQKKRYAIKVLHPEFARVSDVLTRFQREAEAAACVSHPNAIGVYDVALTPQGWPYLVCEYLEGKDFSQHVKDKAPLPAATVRHIALQLCDALVEAHACGVVHRDLKPQNVFLVGDFSQGVPEYPNAKVLDFGLSRFLDSSDGELTKTGVVMGTPSYMAPEQARGERVDHRCDVYGVGAIVYTALTGRPPFKTETPQATVLAVMSEEPPRPTTLNPKIPLELELVLQRAMAKDPDQRYPDMASLQRALRELELPDSSASNDAATRVMLPRSSAELEVNGVRWRFVWYGLLTLALAFAASSAAVAGAVVLWLGRWPFTRMESVLTLLIVLGTLLTPALLLIRRLRKDVWDNTARVVSLLGQMQKTANAGMFAYGTAAMTWLFLDDFLVHFVDLPGVATGSGVHWAGTSLVLLLVAGVVVAGSAWKQRLSAAGGWIDRGSTRRGSRLRRWLAGPVLTLANVVVAMGMLALGTLWRHWSIPTAPDAQVLHSPE